MKKTFFGLLVILLISSCATRLLYTWDKYESASYNFLKSKDDKSLQRLIETYENIIKNQTGTRKVVPPGVYADYGFLLIKSHRVEDGKKMFQKEIDLYPESKKIIDNMLKFKE